jgi:type II secretory ATPase GspE/PulE/Tfp pilus assembly ATPase PilB-like protein
MENTPPRPDITPVQWLEEVLKASIVQRASDIHIEPERYHLVARFRVDGVMREVDRQHKAFAETVISRLKVLANMNVIEKNMPQDGHLEVMMEFRKKPSAEQTEEDTPHSANFRVSVMPTTFGEAAVLRALNRKESLLHIEEVGFSPKALPVMQRILHRPHGIVLVTGPSGSGKTTTLYSVIQTFDIQERVIITLEDPIEYQIPHIRQTQVAPERGLTFAVGLKAILRQDPDVMMIGEIRDEETMEIAVRASLAGRLVFSTLHTNNIPGTIIRMIDMNLGKSMVASALTGIVAQRLVRRVCNLCKQEVPVPQDLLNILRIKWPTQTVQVGKGCAQCGGTGYYGRVGIFEVLEVDDELRALIVQHSTFNEIDELIKKKLQETMRQDGFNKILLGHTTLEEIMKVIM